MILITKLNRPALNHIMAKCENPTYSMYRVINESLEKRDREKYFLKTIWNNKVTDIDPFKEFIAKGNIDLIKGILLSDCIPSQIIEKLKEYPNKPITILSHIREKIEDKPEMIPAFRFCVLQAIVNSMSSATGTELQELIFDTFYKRKLLADSEMTVKNFIEIVKETVEECKIKHKEFNSVIYKLEEKFNNEKPLYDDKLDIFKIVKGDAVFDYEAVMTASDDQLEKMVNQLKEVLNPINDLSCVLALLARVDHKILYSDFSDSKKDYLIYKTAEIYNVITDRLEEIKLGKDIEKECSDSLTR